MNDYTNILKHYQLHSPQPQTYYCNKNHQNLIKKISGNCISANILPYMYIVIPY